MGIAAWCEGFGFLFSWRQIAALVDAGRFGRVGYVRHQRDDADGLLVVRVRREKYLAAVFVAGVQPDFFDDVFDRLAATLECTDWRGMDSDAIWRGTGANLAHVSVVCFALISVIGMLAYAFKGIGKFAVVMLPWHFDSVRASLAGTLPSSFLATYFSDDNIYAIIILGLTSLYVIKGGMISVVITEVLQFVILTITSITIGLIAISKVSPEMIKNVIPAGWDSPFFGWKLGVDWTGILDKVNDAIRGDGNEWFGIIFGLMFFKGILASLAGPLPNYDMQRVLANAQSA